MKEIILIAGSIWFGFSFMIGAINTGDAREKGGTGCTYHSLAAFISPGYLVGCELFRKRWN